ncbi:Rhodanese-like domain-containing protein [Mortierella sp. GBAus27b]|nr:Rhodanese-like domain-containing protein [Mortierella sp. GBAus27b]
MSAPQPVYVDSDVVKELIEDKSKIPGKDYLVIDVRDDDYVGGHIPGAVNYPSRELPDLLPQLIETYRDVPELYFHCALSQVRGPKAARMWWNLSEQERQLAQESGNQAPVQKIHVVRDGFGGWQQKYKDQPHLVEDYNEEYWRDEFL